MKLDLPLSGFLSLAASFSPYLWRRVPLEPQHTLCTISYAVMAVTLPIAFLKTATGIDLYTSLLIALLRHRILLFAGIAAFALLPGSIAFLERRPLPGAAKMSYIVSNLAFNSFGAVVAIMMLRAVLDSVKNLNMLPMFCTEQIILIFIPLCFWIALSYQYEEQQKSLKDHSPSLAWKNQVFNILHLANVYFWALISALLLICYILYCHIHHVTMTLTPDYLIYFTFVLMFFHFICGVIGHDYLYLLFLATVPAILIFCIQWIFWFTVNQQMRRYLALFIVGHFTLYLLIISLREKSLWNLIAALFSFFCVGFCCFFGMPVYLEGLYLPFFSVVMVLLYALVYICLRGRRFIFCRLLLSAVPTALICAALWMSSLAGDKQTLFYQSAFIAVHSAVYMLIVFLREKHNGREEALDLLRLLLHAMRTAAGDVGRWIGKPVFEIYTAILKKARSFLVLGDRFFVVVFVIMVIGYPIFCTLPFSLERVPYKTADNHIRALCENDERAEALLLEIRSSEWYDDSPILEKPDIDQTQYLTFLYDNLREELVDQSAISEEASNITYKEITIWYNEYQ